MAPNSADPPVARQISTNAVMQVVLANGATSRADIAKLTGLSKQTISEVVQSLSDSGWLHPLGKTEGRRGRTAITYEINAKAGLAAAIDLGGTKIAAAIGDLRGNILAEVLQPTDPRGGVELVAQIAGLIEGLAAEAEVDMPALRLAVMGTPGVQTEAGRIDIAPNVPGLDSIDLRALLSERLQLPVLIENDVNLAARGEQWLGHGIGIGNFAFVALGTGIGMGIIADGHLLRGAHGAAGEIGYLPMGGDPYDPRGFTLGTLESAIGSVAIAQRYATLSGLEPLSVREIFSAFAEGDAAAIATIEETARLLAPAIAAVGAMFDPELVILGGSIGIRSELVEAVRHFLPRCTPNPPRIEASSLGSRAALVGGLAVAAKRMHDDLFGVGLPVSGFGLLPARS